MAPTRRWMFLRGRWPSGALAQLVERLLCKQEVRGSIPLGSTYCLVDIGMGVPAVKPVTFLWLFLHVDCETRAGLARCRSRAALYNAAEAADCSRG